MFVRRLAIVAGAAAAAVALSTGSAFAHECYFTNPNPNADAGRSHTPAFMSFHDMAVGYIMEVTGQEMCDDGIAYLAGVAGITPDTLINARGMMAGPTDGNKAIHHADLEAITDDEVSNAFIVCASSLQS
jgi:hypothetical protein